MSKTQNPTPQEELESLSAQIEKLEEPDRKLEAERRERQARIQELKRKQEEIQANLDREKRRAEVASVLRQRVAAWADFEAKQAAWLDLMGKAHAAHCDSLQASIFGQNFDVKLSQMKADEAEIQEVCREFGLDYAVAGRSITRMNYQMEQDLPRFFKPACRPHVLDQFVGHRLADDPELKAVLDEARARQAKEEELAQEAPDAVPLHQLN